MAPEKISKEHESIKKTVSKNNLNNVSTHNQTNQPNDIIRLQKLAGNQAIQRLVIQNLNFESEVLENDTVDRINQERNHGQSLEQSIQTPMSQALGMDFHDVNVHTSQESHNLNRQLNSKAFTTGNDIFFREGEYQPNTTSGQNLIAHELTHVVQQSTGQVPTSTSMKVNPPDDVFEKQAEAIAQKITSPGNIPGIQKQVENEEEEEPVQASRFQRQEMTEEEEI